MAWEVQGIDIGRAAAGAAQIQGLIDAREMREMRRKQMALEQEKAGQEIALRKQKWDALQAYHAGDPTMLQQVDPDLWTKMQDEQRAQASVLGEAQQKQADAASRRAQETGKYQTEWSRMVEHDPRWLPALEVRKAHLVDAGAIDDFDLGGQTVSIEGEGSVNVPAMRMPTKSEEDPYAAPTGDMKEYAVSRARLGIKRDDPHFWDGFESYQIRMANARAPKPPDLGGTGKVASDLRQEFEAKPVVKETGHIASMFEKINSASATDAGDISLLYGYMKIVDPGARVTEGDAANVQNVGNVSSRVVTLYNKIVSGKGGLDDAVRSQFKMEARRLYNAQLKRYKSTAKEFERISAEAGVSPRNVVLPTGIERAGEIEPGSVDDRFNKAAQRAGGAQ